jgi:threonylcarbamoyladenosine tRNA methylthiotransferase MtaB
MTVKENALHMLDSFGSRARAWVQIQNGCDHRCTFCIIPMGRGTPQSVPAGDVVAQARKLVEAGYREIVLTGVDITSYGADLPGNASLGRLVKQVLAHVPEMYRLRLSSIDQVEADEHLLDAIATEPRLMPHLHLSMQAGDDLILKRMKRRHLRDDAIRFCEAVRNLRPDVIFGADLIAGFPTETDAMFENTLDIVERCGLTYLHVFPFSPREGTPAARMPQVDRRVVKERAARLRKVGDKVHALYLDALKGKRIELLMEHNGIGRTPQFAEVRVDRETTVGTIQWATLGHHDGQRLNGMIDA